MRVLLSKKIKRYPSLTIQLRRKFLTITLSVLAVFFIALPAYSQNILVKGHVSDENGAPVQNVSVIVKGTKNGSIGDAQGNFEITAPAKGTLVISAVSFATQELKINNKQSLTISLVTLEKTESEVIVVGYGTQRKRDVTGSTVSVNAQTLQEVPTSNVISELKGRAAGVDIVSNSATPGGGGSIRIRGNRSMASTSAASDGLDQPLLVVDGIPFGGSINDISPDDIQSLDILKDASATAIYGSRGSGGVILITTKRGRTGKPVISYNAYYGISSVMGDLNVFNGPQFAQLKNDAATYNRSTPGTTSYGPTPAESTGITNGTNTDWQKLIYKNGFTSSNQLSLSGGNESTQYGLGATYYDETNEIPNQKFERFSLRTTIDHKINNSFKIGINTITTLGISNTPGGGGVPGSLLRFSPLVSPYNSDGSVNLLPLAGSTDAAFVSPLTLKTASQAILARTRRLRTFNSLYGEWNIKYVKGLKYRINVGLDYQQSQSDNYSGPNTFVNNATSQSQSSASVGNAEAYRYTIENLLTYDKTIKKHRINFTGLFSTQKDHSLSSGFTALGVPSDYIQNTNLYLAGGTISATNNPNAFAEQGLISYMARLNYAYDNRYMLTATVRRDGASVLSPGHQYFTYPAVSAGWNIYNESFMQKFTFISNLKLRGGWGITSNQGVAPYSTLGTLTATAYDFGLTAAGQQAGYIVTNLPNTNLHWESTAQINVGLDFGFLKNRITGSIDYYQQKTKDILLTVNLPPSNGAGNTLENLGKTEGKGIEISVSTVNIQSKNNGFTWATDFNFYLNREKITQLTTPTQPNDIGNGWFVGQPLTVIYDVKKIGIWQTSDSIKGTLAAQTSPHQYPGQIKVQDLNGNGKIDASDRQILGNFQPKWEGGFTSRMSYKNFDFTFVIFARMGMKVLVPYLGSDGSANGYDFFLQSRVNQLKVNYWTRNNPTNDFPAPDASLQAPVYSSTMQYQDGSFVKVRSINLGYTFPVSLLSKAKINSLRFYVSVENPFIIYSPFVKAGYGPDPEGNGYGGAINSTASNNVTGNLSRQISVNANNPPMRLFSLGVNLKF